MGSGLLLRGAAALCARGLCAAAAGRLCPLLPRPLSTGGSWCLRAALGPPGRGEPPRSVGRGRGAAHSEEEEEDLEELLALGPPPGAQRLLVVHPAVKWGVKKPQLTTAELQVAEAVALINTLHNWTVLDKIILSTKTPDKKFIFGKGNFQILTEKIKGLPHITAVFLNIERLSPLTKKELEDAWGVTVFDRYTVVLHIFRCNARTKEAKLQIALAEIPLLRTNLKNEISHLDQQRGGSRYIMGSGETFMEMQYRLLKEKEFKIRNALEKLRRKRSVLRTQRERPHAGYLPSHLEVIYVDTIGFLSELPHDLIESFSATLEDVAYSDLIVHVRDISHPETVLQKASVLSVLKNLNLPSHLLDSVVEVHNKVDLIERYQSPETNAIAVSALLGYGLEELKEEIERIVLKTTGKRILTIKVNLAGPQLSWLYKEATVQEVDVMPENGTANVKVIISNSALGKCKKLFPQ
ncbi:putative GTP-binding protein 6 isoform X4 [Gopherus flavomarginatus]|uniref:putative GTP-binding protein 6 isoform X4 n=1 Tax=Gopherus flavomarginatus TaxID=286002 RepID=UPI0021CC06F7|nr:putative GTP-binding protein 6 isoform X4 [Gopherus flavomarginatus]